MVSTVYLVRHCESLGNISEIFQGQTDGDVSDKGKKQLECLSKKFETIPIDIIYSSPLKRAVKTAEAINLYKKLPIHIEQDLIEIHGGDMEGVQWSELPKLFPESYPVWLQNFASFSAPNGETVENVYHRVKNAVLKIVKENRNKNIVLVSHGCAIYTFLAYINGYEADKISGLNLWTDNTSVTRIEFKEDGEGTIVDFNDCSHVNLSKQTSVHQMFWRTDFYK